MLKIIIICLVLLGVGVLAADENPCVEPGVNRDPSDNASFIICSEVGKSTDVTKVVHCPTGYIFSEEDRTCVEEGKKPHHRVSRATSVLCKSAGPICASCDLLVVCVEMNGKLVPLTNVSCSETSSDNICDAKTQGCRAPTENSACHPATSASSSFQCIQPGFFPDPSDCKKYHICSDNLDHYEDSCDNQYDPVQATCLDNSTCTNPTTESCATDSRPAAISSNPSFYRVCIPTTAPSSTGGVKLSYRTAVMQCSENKQFNDANSSCEFVCKKKPDRFPDPADCHSYYDCPQNLNTTAPMKKTCPQDLAYDGTKKMCALEDKVASCHSITTRAVTETSTSSTSTTPVTSSTTTTTAAPSTRTTTVAPSTTTRRVDECTENSTRQDDTSRYRYYKCEGGRFVQKQCPGFSRYNTLYNSCVYSLF